MTPARPRKPPATSSAPKPGGDELRTRVETLERTVATLRTRSRDAVRTAREAAARVEELEARLAAMEGQAVGSRAPAPRVPAPADDGAAMPDPRPARSVRGRRLSRERDPGDAVPPGVAVEEPEPMDAEATTAFESLQERLSPAKG